MLVGDLMAVRTSTLVAPRIFCHVAARLLRVELPSVQ